MKIKQVVNLKNYVPFTVVFVGPQISFHEYTRYEHSPSSHFLSLPPLSRSLSLTVWSKYSSQHSDLETTDLFFSPLQWESDFTPLYMKWKNYCLVYCNYIVSHRVTFCTINIKRANFQICETKTADRAVLSFCLYFSNSQKTRSDSRKATAGSNNFSFQYRRIF